MSLTAVATGSMSKLMEVQYFGIEKQFMFNRLMWNRAPPGYSCGFSRFWLLWCIRSSLGWPFFLIYQICRHSLPTAPL